jgi:hypothetical protein
MVTDAHLELFKSAAAQWLCDPYSIEIRYVGRKTEPSIKLITCAVNLWPIGTSPSDSLMIETNQIIAGRELITDCSIEDLVIIIEGLEQGKLVLKDKFLNLPIINGISYYSEMISNERWFCDAHLRISGDAVDPLQSTEISKIDNELRLAPLPFDGISDLLNHLNLNDALTRHTQSHIEIRIFPPIDMRIAESSLKKEIFNLTLHAHQKLDIRNVSLALRMFPESSTSRKQVASKIKWKRNKDGIQVGKLRIAARKVFAVLAMLMAGSNTVRRQFYEDALRVPNRRLATFEKFDANLKMLKRALNDTDATAFEIAVNSLAYLLGFSGSVINETDAPDIVLSSPNENIVLIECTTRIKDFSAKLGKLVDRKNSLLSLIKETNDSRKVYSYLICSLPKSNIAYDEIELAKHGVVLITKESLDSLLTQLKFPKDLELLLLQDEQNLEAIAQKTFQANLFNQ